MSELLNKLSSYHVFNYLLPGIVFRALAGPTLPLALAHHDIIASAFLYYFGGLVISRFGSLVVEPILRWTNLVKFAPYPEFVAASKKDSQVDVLSEANNTYRTMTALFTLLLLLRLYAKLESALPSVKGWNTTILVSLLLVMFLLSYRKQTAYVTKRIKANL